MDDRRPFVSLARTMDDSFVSRLSSLVPRLSSLVFRLSYPRFVNRYLKSAIHFSYLTTSTNRIATTYQLKVLFHTSFRSFISAWITGSPFKPLIISLLCLTEVSPISPNFVQAIIFSNSSWFSRPTSTINLEFDSENRTTSSRGAAVISSETEVVALSGQAVPRVILF